jgi:gamma-glutamylcyclotransferase (GGCT)/AIG2-like uncharacterized protein YtfP
VSILGGQCPRVVTGTVLFDDSVVIGDMRLWLYSYLKEGIYVERHYVFVYGTLRRHERNFCLLNNAELVAAQAWTNGQLYDTGFGYPAIQESRTGVVYGELYLISEEQLRRLDELEGYSENSRNNLYNR